MKKTLIALALLAASSVVAAPVADDFEPDKDFVTLTDEAVAHCSAAHKDALRATYTYRSVGVPPHFAGKVVEGCWLAIDGTVHLIFADGDAGAAPVTAFRWKGKRPAAGPSI